MKGIGISTLQHNKPVGVEIVAIDPDTGLIGDGCPQVIEYPFINGSGPTSRAPCARSGSLVEDGILWFQRFFD
jgi:hypothetical protein